MGERMHDIFGPGANVKERVVRDYDYLRRRVEALRELGLKIVLTAGAYDLIHEGHARYLEIARRHGDVLIVGVDNDEKVRQRKGHGRPLVTEEERMEMLCQLRHVDLVFLKKLGDPKWQLIKTVRPDVLIATETTYDETQREALREFCGEVVALPPQSATSTTAKVRLLLARTAMDVKERFEMAVEDVRRFLDELIHGGQ